MKPISYNILVMCRTILFDNDLLALMNIDASLLWLLIHLHSIQGVPGIVGTCCLVDDRCIGDACCWHISRNILDLIVTFIVLLIQNLQVGILVDIRKIYGLWSSCSCTEYE